jgi:hypothetical protein
MMLEVLAIVDGLNPKLIKDKLEMYSIRAGRPGGVSDEEQTAGLRARES